MSVSAPVSPRLVGRGVTRRFAPGRGLSEVSFDLSGPTVVAVVGPNGSGKTTLLRLVAGLLRPSTGSVSLTLGGRDVPPAERRRVVGLASPQLAFYDELTVGENLAFVAEARGIAPRADAVRTALARVGLTDRANDRAATLSSGMTQRLRLAFAVLHRPPVLLLDEPGSHLDDEGRAVTDALVQEQRREGLVVLATNDPRETARADSRVELRGGLGHPA